jgi:hypothetical protein
VRILHDTLSMKKLDLHWVSHAMDANEKTERVILAHEILSTLQSVRCTDFQCIITGDESWFFRYYPPDLIRVSS